MSLTNPYNRKSLQNLLSAEKKPFKQQIRPHTSESYQNRDESSIFSEDYRKLKAVSKKYTSRRGNQRPQTHTIRIYGPERLYSSQVTIRPVSQSQSQTQSLQSSLAQTSITGVISELGRQYGTYGPCITRESVLMQQIYNIEHADKPKSRSVSAQNHASQRQKLVENPYFDYRILKTI